MSANLCVVVHMQEPLKQGFEVAIVKGTTAAAETPELGAGYTTAYDIRITQPRLGTANA